MEGEAISFQARSREAGRDKGFCRMVTVYVGHYRNFFYRSFFAPYRKLYIKTITDRHYIVGALMNTGVSRHGPETIVLKKIGCFIVKTVSSSPVESEGQKTIRSIGATDGSGSIRKAIVSGPRP